MRLPNIVILYADDLGYGDVGCYNENSKIPTPHLDRLARQGMRFTDAHSSSGICTPSRYALLTGRHHWRKFHRIVQAFGPSMFDAERLTMPEMLQQRGYRTACIGKWHLGWDWSGAKKKGAKPQKGKGFAADQFDWSRPVPDGPLAHGFDYYFGDDVPNFPPYTWIENDHVVTAPTVPYCALPKPPEGSHEGRPGPMAEGWRLDEVMPELTKRAVSYVHGQKDADQPFFLYVPFTAPHAPIVPSGSHVGSSEAGPYGDFVAQTDATCGAVLQALEDAGLADDTLVVFTSDNGPEHYAYERMRKFDHHSSGGLRGLKRDVWEGGHRVPMIVRWPDIVDANQTTGALVGQVDLMATLASLVGFELPQDQAEDSFNLMPLWLDETDRVRDFLVHNTFAKKWGIRRGKWLLIDQKDGTHSRVPKWLQESYSANDKSVMLCDLEQDLEQKVNLAAQHPDVVAELRSLLKDVRERGHSAPRLATETKQ
ncbi:MAG: arylsulfatase A [Planctomycetota bacterium]|jgi:arylsulfatase A